ncbi:ash family protein [Arsenophonus sp. PmNCSU2021_1]|uniref:ash family protein n=1 Tax=Arsenophonus sp. PmNCSU2021_1 TaxID=3118989 RepID=UPI002FF37F4F
MVATTQTRPEFIDTYWIIQEYSTTPYGKVSFTRQDRRTSADNCVDFIKNPLPILANFAYSNHALVNPSDRFGTLNWYKATIDAEDSVFFYVVDNASQHSMVALSGQSSDWLVSLYASSSNPDSVTAHKEIGTSSGDFLNKYKEIASMATIPSHTHSKFTDTYWVIRLDSNRPYGKVSFTHRDFRTFTTLFKDSRLIWAGRQPVHASMEGN